MDLVNIDTIGPQSTEGIFDLFLNPSRRRISEYLPIFRPLQADFGCENRMTFTSGITDDRSGNARVGDEDARREHYTGYVVRSRGLTDTTSRVDVPGARK